MEPVVGHELGACCRFGHNRAQVVDRHVQFFHHLPRDPIILLRIFVEKIRIRGAPCFCGAVIEYGGGGRE